MILVASSCPLHFLLIDRLFGTPHTDELLTLHSHASLFELIYFFRLACLALALLNYKQNSFPTPRAEILNPMPKGKEAFTFATT